MVIGGRERSIAPAFRAPQTLHLLHLHAPRIQGTQMLHSVAHHLHSPGSGHVTFSYIRQDLGAQLGETDGKPHANISRLTKEVRRHSPRPL